MLNEQQLAMMRETAVKHMVSTATITRYSITSDVDGSVKRTASDVFDLPCKVVHTASPKLRNENSQTVGVVWCKLLFPHDAILYPGDSIFVEGNNLSIDSIQLQFPKVQVMALCCGVTNGLHS